MKSVCGAMQKREQGSALMICLVFLLLLTVIGAGAMQSATLQERMAGNSRDSVSAFQASEGVVRNREEWLRTTALPAFDGSDGRYQRCEAGDEADACEPPAWNDDADTGWAALNAFDEAASRDPEYILEELRIEMPSPTPGAEPQIITIYRVTGRGYGYSDTSSAVVQTNYRRN